MRLAVGWIAAAAVLLPLHAQEKKESASPAVYKVEFEIRDGGQGSRHYAMVIDESRKGIFQAGSRVPAVENSAQGPYVDAGVKIECAVRQAEGKVALEGSVELTEPGGVVSIGGINEPIIGQKKMVFHASVEPGTRTVIVSAGKHEVEATVTEGPSSPR
jgi:hypothetical protein